MDRNTLKDIAYRLAVEETAQPWTNITYHGTPNEVYLRYDPSFAFTGEGSNMYGISNYSITDPETAKSYSTTNNKRGTVLTEFLPDEKYYINPDLPFNQQSKEVQAALKNAGYKVLNSTGNSLETFEDFAKRYSIENNLELNPYTQRKFLNAWEDNLYNTLYGPLPKTKINPGGNSVTNYREMLKWSKKANLPGIVRYKPTAQGLEPVKVFQTTNPDDVEIRNTLEPEQRSYAKQSDVKKAADRIMRGFDKTKLYQQSILSRAPIQAVLNSPITKSLGRAAGSILGTLGGVGDAIMAGQFLYGSSQFNPENREWNRSGNPIPTRGVGMVYPASNSQPYDEPTLLLKGGIKYYD